MSSRPPIWFPDGSDTGMASARPFFDAAIPAGCLRLPHAECRDKNGPGRNVMAKHEGDIALKERSTGDLTINTNGVLHFSISARDHVKSAEWYRDVVGARIARVNDHFAFMQCGKDYFVLVKKDDHVEPNVPGDTQFHYAFMVTPPDFDKAMDILR